MRVKREKKKLEVSVDSAEEKKPQMQRIKTDRNMKIGRIVLWMTILFLLLRGVFSICSPNSEQRVEQIVSDYKKEAELREKAQIEATAYAEGFLCEYYTFAGKASDDYERRVSRYFAKNVEWQTPIAGKVETQVLQTQAQKVWEISSKEYDVDVHAVVSYTPLAPDQQPVVKDLYLRVPIAADKKGALAVVSLPSYIPKEKTANVCAVDTYTGQQVENKEMQKIRDNLNSFFLAYYNGTDTDISYYLALGSNITAGIGSAVSYKKIDYLSICTNADGEYLADVTVTVTDMDQPMRQRLFLHLKKAAKGRYYIKSIYTRPI